MMVGMNMYIFSPGISMNAVGKVYDFPSVLAQVCLLNREYVQNPTGTKTTLAKGNRHKVPGSRPENSWQKDRVQ